MSFLTSHMEAMLALATDPEEIELRRRVLEDHVAMAEVEAQRRKEFDSLPDATALTGDFDNASGVVEAEPDVPAVQAE